MGLVSQGAFVAGCYFIPKIINYLTTAPDQTVTKIEQIRAQLAPIKTYLKNEFFSEKIWFVITQCIGQNAWIAAIALLYLSPNLLSLPIIIPRVGVLEKIEYIHIGFCFFLAITAVASTSRFLLAKGLEHCCPKLSRVSRFISPEWSV